MKLFIKEAYPIFTQRQLNSLLMELLNPNDKLKKCKDYITTTDLKEPYNVLVQDPGVQEVKQDLKDMLNRLKSELEELSNVNSVNIKASEHYGLSNYIEVKFRKPTNTQYLSSKKQEYYMNIRVSDHIPPGGYSKSVTNNYDIVDKTFNQIRSSIIQLVQTQNNKISQFENNWNQKHPRNRLRFNNAQSFNNALSRIANESYESNVIKARLNDETLMNLDLVHIDYDEILSILRDYMDFDNVPYNRLLTAIADNLNKYSLDYTFDDYMDYEMLADDVEKTLNSSISSFRRQPCYA